MAKGSISRGNTDGRDETSRGDHREKTSPSPVVRNAVSDSPQPTASPSRTITARLANSSTIRSTSRGWYRSFSECRRRGASTPDAFSAPADPWSPPEDPPLWRSDNPISKRMDTETVPEAPAAEAELTMGLTRRRRKARPMSALARWWDDCGAAGLESTSVSFNRCNSNLGASFLE